VDSWLALTHPDDQERLKSYLDTKVLTNNEPFNQEYRIIRKNDGQVRWVHGLGKLIFNDDREAVSMHGTIQDITERKAAHLKLRQLSQAVEQSPNSVVITDVAGNIEYTNTTFTRSSGYQYAEVKGKNPRILQSGKTASSIYEEMWRTLTSGKTWHGELVNQSKDKREYTERAIISPVYDESGETTHYLAIKEDITEQKEAQSRIDKLINFDRLTGLPNREMLNEHFSLLLNKAHESIMFMLLDLDRFKEINDTLGHSIGDQLLIIISSRLRKILCEEHIISRMGGDEFVIVIPGRDANQVAQIADELINIISQSCKVGDHELCVTASIGIATYPADGNTLESLMASADAAMYRAKTDGRNRFQFFEAKMQKTSERMLLLGHALWHAVENNELVLHYQPQISIADGRLVGAEALIRWHHPELGFISPAEFIPIAESNGQILQIGEWVLRVAARQLTDWIALGYPPLVMAVNMSAIQFRQLEIVETVINIVDAEGLPPHLLELELTEAIAMENPETVIKLMDTLNEYGFQLAIDDFGTGYSSLSYLKKLSVHKLKIDQSFVRHLDRSEEDRAIVTAIISLAQSLGLTTIAEGVEERSQVDFLQAQGCDQIQGYYYSKPLTAEKFEDFMKSMGSSG